MAVTEIAGSISVIGNVLLKLMQLVDPSTRQMVRWRKALKWAGKYVQTMEELSLLPTDSEDKKVVKRIKSLQRKRKYYRQWFWENNL